MVPILKRKVNEAHNRRTAHTANAKNGIDIGSRAPDPCGATINKEPSRRRRSVLWKRHSTSRRGNDRALEREKTPGLPES